MEKLFYTIGEVADILGETVSSVRFWSKVFSDFVNPKRNAKGNRLFTKEELDVLKQIRFLLRDKGFTIEGAAMALSEDRASVQPKVKAIDMLKSIRQQLLEVRASIN